MSSRCRERLHDLALAVIAATALAVPRPAGAEAGMPVTTEPGALRVCADPDNLPYSHADGSGFENRIAQLVADDLGRPLQYAWQGAGHGLLRKTFGADRCDVFIGMPAGLERVQATRAYYRSGYVFVVRADAADPLTSFADPRLGSLRIGVQLVGDDLAATPPGQVLARRGATRHVVGYPVLGALPAAARAIRDLQGGALDAALLWGPQAGFFAARATPPLRLVPAVAPTDAPQPFAFDITMAVRPGHAALRAALDGVLARRAADIDKVLEAYHVPRLPLPRVAGGGP